VKNNGGRARRFALHFSLRYRPVGAAQWHQGRIENISRSGVLFWTDNALEVDTRVEMSFVLPLLDSPWVVCRGHIVRAVLPSDRQAPLGLAATISAYRFVRGKTAAA
jgi:PilZ domain-containing protein